MSTEDVLNVFNIHTWKIKLDHLTHLFNFRSIKKPAFPSQERLVDKINQSDESVKSSFIIYSLTIPFFSDVHITRLKEYDYFDFRTVTFKSDPSHTYRILADATIVIVIIYFVC